VADVFMTNQLEQNKQTVTAFYDLMFNQCKPAEAIQKYAGDVYIQHNPNVCYQKSREKKAFCQDPIGI
jgi:predicted SnoaL-like aldol condensation-catalyzing enzyme